MGLGQHLLHHAVHIHAASGAAAGGAAGPSTHHLPRAIGMVVSVVHTFRTGVVRALTVAPYNHSTFARVSQLPMHACSRLGGGVRSRQGASGNTCIMRLMSIASALLASTPRPPCPQRRPCDRVHAACHAAHAIERGVHGRVAIRIRII